MKLVSPYITGSTNITGSVGVQGTLSVTNGITGNLFGTAATASYVDAANIDNLAEANYSQSFVNLDTWTINHNLNADYVAVQIYDTNNEQVLPLSIDLQDENTAIATFGTPFSGTALVVVGSYIAPGGGGGGGGGGGEQLTITTSTNFSTSDFLVGPGDQNGKHVIIDNGASNITITIDSQVNSFYQKIGTGTVTFVAGPGRTLATTNGATILAQYGGASLSYNGTTSIVVVGGTGFFFDESPEVRIGDYRIAEQINDSRFPPLTPQNSSSGDYLTIRSSNYFARTQDRWYDVALDLSALPGTLSDYDFYAKRLVPGYSEQAVGLHFTASVTHSYIQTNVRYPVADGNAADTKTMAIEITAKSGSQYVDSVIHKFGVEPTGSLSSGQTISLVTDIHPSSSTSPSSSFVFGVPFAPGQLWNENRVTLQYVGGASVPYQREVTGNWITSGSIQWVQLRTVAPSGSNLEVVVDGPNTPYSGSNLVTSIGGGEYQMEAGEYTLILTQSYSPIKTIKKGSTVIADCTNARGLYLLVSNAALTASGELAQSAGDATITIESAGPVSSCVKIEGDYITSGGVRVAKHITRLESHKGIDGVNISHTLIISNNTNNIWFSEMGWEFSTNPTNATSVVALFNDSTKNLQSVTEIPLSGLVTTASILQETYPTFGRTGATPDISASFSIYENGILSASYLSGSEGASMGEWFGYKSDNNGLVWGIQDAARQAPKEIVVTQDKINLMLFSPNSGDEIDFRTSRLYNRWNLAGVLPYYGTTSASFVAYNSNAFGWSKTTKLLLLPIGSSPDTGSIAAEANKLRYPDYGFVDANWMYQSDAMGPLYPYDSASFDLAEKTLDGQISVFTGSVPGVSYNTFFDYYTGPAYFYDQRYRLNYTLINDSWLLTARNANRNNVIRRETRKFAENTTRAFRDSYTCHLDDDKPFGTSGRKLKGVFMEGNGISGDFPMYWMSDGAFNLATTTSILKLVWDYHISGERRSKDVAIDYGNAFKVHFPFNTRSFRTLPNGRLIAQVYQLSGDYELLLAVEKWKNGFSTISNQFGPLVYDKDGALLLTKNKAYESSTYKVNTDIGSLIEAWKITGSDILKQMSLRIANYWRNAKMGRSSLTRISGIYDSFLFYNSGLLSQGQIIDFNFRSKNLKYNTSTGASLSVGFSTLDTVTGGMPYQMDVITKTSSSLKPVSSFVAFRAYQNSNPIFIKKGNNDPGIVTYFQPSSAAEDSEDEVEDEEITEDTTQGGFTFKILKNPLTTQTWSGNDPIPVTQNGVNPGNAIKLEIAKDLGANILTRTFAYKFKPSVKKNIFLVTDSTASVVFRNDGHWMPFTVRPNYRYYVNVTSSASNPSLFFEFPYYLYDPTGSLYTGAAVSKSINLPSTGSWSFTPVDYPSLVSSSGMPPYFAINSASFWFDPLTTIGATTASSVYSDIQIEPQYYPDLGATTGVLVSGSVVGDLRIISSSGDAELFSNVSGTLEFYFKADGWDSFTMADLTGSLSVDKTVNIDLSPVRYHRKWMMQIISDRLPSNPPTTGSSSTGNLSWSIYRWQFPNGSRGSTAYPSLEPTHAWYYRVDHYNETGSGPTGQTRALFAEQEIILQDKWYHIALTWNKNTAPVFYVNGRKYESTDASANYYPPNKPWYINFPYYLKGYITNLRVSKDVIYNSSFTPRQGEQPYGFDSGSTLFYAPLSASGDFSYIASGSKTINISFNPYP